MRKTLQEAIESSLYPPVKLVDPACSCSKADLKEFGFCLCGNPNPPIKQVAKNLSITIYEDRSGSIDDDLMREFLELIGELPKKP